MYSQSYVLFCFFSVVMYGCESWNIKKAECWRIETFKLWCWSSLLRVPWTERRLNQSILKEINPECLLEELMLKLQYFGHLMQRAKSSEKTLLMGKIEGRRRGQQRTRWLGWCHWLNRHEFEQLQELVDREAWRAGAHGAQGVRQDRDRTTTTICIYLDISRYI